MLDVAVETFGGYVESRTQEYIRTVTERRQETQSRKSGKGKGKGRSSKEEAGFKQHLEDMAYRFAYGEEPPKVDPKERAKGYRSLASLVNMAR